VKVRKKMGRYIRLLVLISFASVAGLSYAQQTQSASSSSLDYAFFKNQVQPIFAAKRPGHTRCITCHSAFAASGPHIEPPGPDGTWTEAQSRQNFEFATRRVVPGDPVRSRLLLHPLRAEGGGDRFHFGGKHWDSPNDPEWVIINSWVLGKKAGS
jgi:hypothetical protein